MLETYLRPTYQRFFLDPITQILVRTYSRITPNRVTVLSAIVGILSACCIAHFPLIAAILLLLSGGLDTLDGTLARYLAHSTDFGCLLDIISDRVVEVAVILGLFSVAPELRAWPALLMLSSVLLCVTSFLIVGVLTPNDSEKGFHYSPGIMERFEAFIFFVAMILFPAFYLPLSLLFSGLVLLTAYLRIKEFARH